MCHPFPNLPRRTLQVGCRAHMSIGPSFFFITAYQDYKIDNYIEVLTRLSSLPHITDITCRMNALCCHLFGLALSKLVNFIFDFKDRVSFSNPDFNAKIYLYYLLEKQKVCCDYVLCLSVFSSFNLQLHSNYSMELGETFTYILYYMMPL